MLLLVYLKGREAMEKLKKIDRMILKYLVILIVLVFVVVYHSQIFNWISNFIGVISPLIIGAVLAYILNILMEKFERWYFPDRDDKLITATRRPLSILASIVVVIIVLLFILNLVIPQLVSVVEQVVAVLPEAAVNTRDWVLENEELFPPLADFVDQLDVNWQNLVQRALNIVNDITGSFINTAFSTVTSVFSIIVNLFLSLMIAIYLLVSKESLLRNFDTVFATYLPHRYYTRFKYVTGVFNNSFRSFITVEVIEAAILGVMVTVGMLIFRFPYATMIGALTGVTAIIPILGAYISGTVGFILILMHSPLQALLFVLFIVITQQIEGNIIYPRVVGNSIGLPGLWVLVAVTIGGGVMGVAGMLLAVPTASALYRMLKDHVNYRNNIKSNQIKTSEDFLIEHQN